jgi:hypothetical protein
MKYRLTQLEGLEVVREDGRTLGRLRDVRSRANVGIVAHDAHYEADALLLGASGWLEEMGLRQGGAREVSARAIVTIDSAKVVVRASAPASREPRTRRKRR